MWFSSRRRAAIAEERILAWGVAWYARWAKTHGGCTEEEQAACFFQTKNVPVGELGGGCHIHQARYFKGHVSEKVNAAMSKEEDGCRLPPVQNDCEEVPLVCCHGFGTGVGQFATVLPAIRRSWRGPVLALDWFGCGASSRPRWSLGFHKKDRPEELEAYVRSVELFFIKPLEDWRVAMGFESMVLLGHSIGGYLATCYALEYPERVERLILVSPVGIPRRPVDGNAMMRQVSWKWKVFLRLWDDGWSPFTAAKIFGRVLMKWYVSRRYQEASWTPKELLTEYLYTNWTHAANSGGGYSQNTLLQVGAWARCPLIDRVRELKVSNVSFIYGSRDWVDYASAAAVAETLPRVNVEMLIVADGGHNMMVDNPIGFAEAVMATGSRPFYGKTYGNMPLLLESGRKFAAGQKVQAVRGGRRDWQWQKAVVSVDHGDGTFDLQWEEIDGATSRQGGYTMRYADEDVKAEHLVRF